jgi:micrococcal nuclease
VEYVQDGDTLRCRGGERVRLLLIDTPELSQRPFGDQARRALQRLVPPGTRVTLETDRQPRDRYQRLLAYVWTRDSARVPSADGSLVWVRDSALVNRAMVDSGYAVVLYYSPNGRDDLTEFNDAEAAARAARKGLHAEGGFDCSPIEHRRKRC